MGSLRRLLARRVVPLHLAVVVVASTCVRLGFWQLDRLEQRRAFNALVRAREAMPAEPVDRLLLPGTEAAAASYRRAWAEGRYDPGREVLLFGRSLDGAPGSHVLTPLLLPDGRALVVDRGWVPLDVEEPPVAWAAPPSGRVRVEGILLPPESADPDALAGGRLERVSLAALARALPYPLLPAYLELRRQDPPPGPLPRPAPPPELTEGPHLSYAVQWFLFAAVAVAVYAALLRRELRRTA
ncbi:MAG TPA: SURF1 family protein [Actinomycetota bacterium]|nr:SURF1 family protein [Actinomycetota bacterium]